MDDYKLLIALVKYIPLIGGISMILHVAQLLLGYNPMYAHFMFGFSIFGCIMLLLAAYVLKFNKIYKAFVLYDFTVENCIKFLQVHGFGVMLTTMRWIVLLIGLYLLSWFIYDLVRKNSIGCIEGLRRQIRHWYLSIKQRRGVRNSLEHSSYINEQTGSSGSIQRKSKNHRKKRKRRTNTAKSSDNSK